MLDPQLMWDDVMNDVLARRWVTLRHECVQQNHDFANTFHP